MLLLEPLRAEEEEASSVQPGERSHPSPRESCLEEAMTESHKAHHRMEMQRSHKEGTSVDHRVRAFAVPSGVHMAVRLQEQPCS